MLVVAVGVVVVAVVVAVAVVAVVAVAVAVVSVFVSYFCCCYEVGLVDWSSPGRGNREQRNAHIALLSEQHVTHHQLLWTFLTEVGWGPWAEL